MDFSNSIASKICELSRMLQHVAELKLNKKTIAFTNGCFDLLHEGHAYSLSQAAQEADFLIVAINSDNSVKKLKGTNRPINNENTRALQVASISMVDAVIIFDAETPFQLIDSILPDVLVKGGDYTIDQIVGAKEVINAGGKVVINPILNGFSTTTLIEKMSK